jgi:hypothetical protein
MIRVIIQLVQGKRYKIYNHIIRFSKFSLIFFYNKSPAFLDHKSEDGEINAFKYLSFGQILSATTNYFFKIATKKVKYF